jgi:ATP-binding protein involved in chromosome partitioning
VADQAALLAAIEAAAHPDLRRTLGELGLVRSVEGGDGDVMRIFVVSPGIEPESMIRAIRAAVGSEGADAVIDVAQMSPDDQSQLVGELRKDRPERPGAKGSSTRVLTIASGKGGVGKSSVAANLAVAMARLGHDVAVVDADVWGFSIPRMLGVEGAPAAIGREDQGLIVPARAHGVRVISMGFFVGPDQAVIWRGPMLHKALEQFLDDVFWDEPEILLVDLPPGTGDIAISLAQFLPSAEAVIVTTPQATAQAVARRAALMARQVEQEVCGVIENMSWFTGDDGVRYELFGAGGGEALADELGVPFLGQIPLLPLLREGADRGEPAAVVAPGSEAAQAFDTIATRILKSRPRVRRPPELQIE